MANNNFPTDYSLLELDKLLLPVLEIVLNIVISQLPPFWLFRYLHKIQNDNKY